MFFFWVKVGVLNVKRCKISNVVVSPWNKELLIDLDRYEIIREDSHYFTKEEKELMKKLHGEGLELEYYYKMFFNGESKHIKETIKFDTISIVEFEAVINNEYKYKYVENKEFVTLEELFVIVHGMIKGPCYCMGF